MLVSLPCNEHFSHLFYRNADDIGVAPKSKQHDVVEQREREARMSIQDSSGYMKPVRVSPKMMMGQCQDGR